MIQNNISSILKNNPIIPVATIDELSKVDKYYEILINQNINCIEITLRNDISWDAIEIFKKKYGSNFKVGVGTITCKKQIDKCVYMGVDFMVSPGHSPSLIDYFDKSNIPFLPGISTPSEIIYGINKNLKYFKFFPANVFGGVKALKTYQSVFKDIYFCPTGGLNSSNFDEYLNLNNVISVGGSWILNK